MDKIAKIVNFRFFLIMAIFAIFSIVVALFLPSIIAIISGVALLILLLILGVIFAVKNKVVKSITAFSAFIVVAICSINTLLTINSWKCDLSADTEYEITAKIESVNENEYGVGYLLTNFSANGVSQNGNIYLSVNRTDGVNIAFLKVGDMVRFNAILNFYQLVDEKVDGYRYRNDIRYGSKVDESAIEFIGANPNLLDSIRDKVYSVLNSALGEHGRIAYGMITGDKGYIADATINAYSISGIGPILAVSGLHIGFVALVINWLLTKLKANRLVKLGIMSVCLLSYCFSQPGVDL